MSDKAGRATNKNLSVAKTLDEVIRVFDDVPMLNDLATEFWLSSYAVRASLFHYALELGMKCMSSYEKKRHTLMDIYRAWPESERDMRDLLDSAFEDARASHGVQFDREGWMHLRDFESYLRGTGDGGLFQDLRYWPLDGESDLFERPSPLPDLLISREMVRFMSDVLQSTDSQVGDELFVSQLVDQEIHASFHQEGYVDNGNSQRFNEEPEALEEDNRILRQWVARHDSLLLAIKDAYEHDFDVLNEWSNTVLKGVYDSLKETDDCRIKPALDYAFSTFGAKTSDCDREVISSAQVQLHQNGRRGTVKTPSGHPLGNITERHDGLWTAENTLGTWRELAVDRDNAIGLLIENGTEKVSVTLNGGTPRETWAHFQNLNMSRFFEVDAVCEFWDTNHGIKVGDEISILGAGQVKTLSDPDTHGIVKSVNNHTVVVAVSRHH